MSFHKIFSSLDPSAPRKTHAMAPGITEVESVFQFDNLVKGLLPTQLLVIDFHAVWCGPCHAIAPVYAKLAAKYAHVKFVKVDVDRNQQLAQRFRISAMPTFKFLKGGREIAELRGASPPQLNALVAQHAGPVPSTPATTSGSSSSAGAGAGAAPTPSAPSAPADNMISLLSQISARGLTCLNESSSHPLSSIIGPSHGPRGSSYLESDADAELLITIPFNEPVKLKAISIFGGVSPSQAPKEVKLYINQLSMDFGDAENLAPAQELELSREDIGGNKVELRFVRFQNVRSLHILVKSNQEDDETTRIDSIDLFGTVGDSTDKGPLPKHEHEH
ncbi:Thioredoxin homolog 3 [Saitozyma sp. JCM 24511]|nr:Thioredoxin homolog 3 [Saitozyma sp. JCM 24511]